MEAKKEISPSRITERGGRVRDAQEKGSETHKRKGRGWWGHGKREQQSLTINNKER